MSKLADEFGLGAGAEAGQRKRSSLAEEFGLGGVKPSKPGIVRSAADTATALAGGAVTGAQQLANVAGADNPIAQTLGDGAKAVRDFESPARRAEREQRAAKIQQAEDSGSTWEEVKANVGAFAEAPIDTTVEAVGTSLPTIAAAALTRGRAPAITGGAVGALQGAGAVKGSIYDAVEQEYLKAGVSPEEAAARAAEAQAYSGENLAQIGVGAGLGGVAGSTGVESAVARLMSREAGAAAAQGVLRSALTGAAKEAPLEAVQGGQERLASNLALQGEGFNTPTWQGVAGSAALEGVAGAAAGGGFGAVEGVAGRSDQQLTSTVELGDEPSVAGDSSASAPLEESVNEPAAPPVVDDAAGAVQAPADRAVPPAVLEQFRLERPFPASRAEAVPLSQQMGLDPAAGPMSSAAALAVDSGATAQLQQQAVLQEAAKAAEKGGTASEQVNQETGEIAQAQGDLLAADPATELQTRLEYVRQQARAGGWDARLVAERDRLVAELDQLLPQQAAADAASQAVEQPAAPADLQTGIEQAQANAAAVEAAAGDAPADIRAVVAKQIPQMTDAELQQAIDHYGPDNKRTTKLQKELAKRRTQPHEEANAGEAPAEAQTEEQPAQVAPAPEAAPAEAAPAVDAGARWAGMSQADRQALAEQTDIRPVIRRNLPRAQWESMNPDVQRRLAERMQQAPGKPATEQSIPAATEDHPAVGAWLSKRFADFKKRNKIPDGADIKQTIAVNEGSPNIARSNRAAKLRTELRDIEKGRDAARRWLADNPDQAAQLGDDARLDFADPVSSLEFYKTGNRPRSMVDEAEARQIRESGAMGAQSVSAAPEAQATARPGLPALVSVGPSGFEPTPIGGKLYREMSPQNLADALRMHNQGDVSSAFFTDNIDLALGQGDNRGVMVQYRGEAVSGSQHRKPGITERTGREYRADYVGADAIDQVLLPSGARLSVLAKNMLARHFDRTEPEEGRILYTRKGVDVGAPLHQLMATGTQQSIPAARAPRGVLAKKAEAEGDATEFPLKAAAASYAGISVRAEDAAQTQAAAPAAAPQADSSQGAATASSTPSLDSHVALMKSVRSGEATADEYKAAFAHADANQEALTAELNTMKKDDLLKSGGYSFFHRYRNDKKADIVAALVNRILDEYALGRRYGSSSFVMSAAGLAAHRQAQDLALRELVANTTDNDLKAHAAEVAEERKEVQSRRESQQKAVETPQTLADFRQAVSYHMQAHGETRQQAFMRLTPEQRIRYDELEADSTKAQREQAKTQAKTRVASAGQTTASEVIETKHTKHGHDLFVIQLADRVDREDYDTLNTSAKRLGGSYSSYRGNGAVPGFQFRTRDAAEAFRKLVVGDTADAQAIAEARRDAFEDDRSQSAAERLRTMAQALDERAEESLARERKQNTDRRARMAASAESAARADKALAATMNNLAQAIEEGRAKFLDTVRQKVQVEFLGRELRNAKDAQIRATSPSYADQEKRKGELVNAETVDYATFPTYTAMRSDLASLARQMVGVDGLKKLGARLEKVADDMTEAYTEWAKQNLLSVSRFTRGDQFADFKGREDAERAIRRSGLAGKAIVLPVKRGQNRIVMAPSEAMKLGLWQGDGDKRITLSGEFGGELVQALGRRSGSKITVPWALESAHEKRKRLEGMGILTGSEYRSALREFATLREAPAAPDKIKEMERAMIGRRADGLDFFPTSDAVVGAMLDAADIGEGMSVLEPSAGMGHIADAIREQAGVEPDVVELSGERRELLEAKGYRLAGRDFMDMQPRSSFTFGDVFRTPDGTLGVMRGQGGMGSNRVRLQPLDENGMPDDRRSQYVDRDDLVGVEHRGADSGYDRIVMNPPFSKGRDIQHVQHAYSLLRPGGRLVAIMGEGAFFQSNQKAESFRAWLDGLGATSERLPEGSFMDPSLPVNTSVNARLVVIDKPMADEAGPSQPDEQPTVQYSFAGRNAQGADRLALETARQRVAMGEDAEAVRQDTGWHRGAEGKWRFEISDDQARIAVAGANAASIIANAEMRAAGEGRTGATVGDVLDHPQLFAAYPGLRSLPLRLMPPDVPVLARLQRLPVGFAVQMQGTIPQDQVASTLIHELQHAIQNIEGFALGGSRRMFASDFDATGAETYRRLAGEVEARNVQMRMRMTPGLRQAIAPESTVDVPSGDVLVTFNGRDLVGGPQPQNITGRQAMTAQGLVRAFDLQFPKLTRAVRTMLQRGQEGKRGGLVFIDSPDPLRIAGVFSRKTGNSLSASVQLFEDKGRIQGFYDAKSGLTFLVGPNLDPVTGPAVLLHEMTHGQQRAKIDQQASNMLMNRASVKNADLRAFLDRVAGRMVDAGETANPREAAAYIVEQAVIEGREQGFGEADSRFLGWVDQAIGKPVGDFLRNVLAMVRQWMLRHGLPIGQITVGDLVDYAMAGVERAAAGDVRGEGVSLSQDDLQKARILQGPPVSVLRGDEAPRGFAAVREWATQLFKDQGGMASNPDLGDVVLDGRAVRDSLGHGRPNPYKYAAFAAVKEVLERGALVHQASYKGGESFYVSAPVIIDGMDDIVTVLVRREPNMQRMYLHSVATKGYLLSRRGSGADAVEAEQRTGSSDSEDVASVLQRLLTATVDSDPGDGPQFSRSGLRDIAGKATLELNRTFTAPGKLSWWHKTIGTMYNLAERSPFFKPVFEAAQGFIDDVSHYAADAAEHAPKLLPKLETWRDITKSPVSAADNKAVAKPVFEGTLMWARDVDGQPVRVDSLAERAAKLTTDQKAEILLATGKVPPGMLNAWRALSPERFGKMVDSRYEAQMLKAGIVWTDAELRSIFKLTDQQVELYREFRAATDRSLDTMARADMLRFLGQDGKALRDEVMDAPDLQAATRLLRDHLAQQADFWPDRATHLLDLAHGVTERAERVAQLQAEGYAPLSRFGKYTIDVVDQNGERQYFSLFESKREANLMAEQLKDAFPGAAISQGTLSEEAYKLFAGITPETLELFGNALGFDSQGDSAQDQAFQEYLRLTKTNRSAMRRLIHRKGIAGYSEDVGRVLASFVYSNARQAAAGLHLGDLAEAVDAIPQQQGELKDAAVRLAEYIKNPQEEAQAVRGLLFAQYLGGSVASAAVNMTQPVAVSFPWLSQYGGAGKAAAALGRAAKHMSTKGYQYEADLAKALKAAEDDGVVSPQEVHQLMAQARGSGSLRAGDGTPAGEARAAASNAVSRLSVAWGKLFGAAEQINRRVTFIAAYRLAKDQGMSDPAAFARRAVTETQFVYSKASKMQWGRGAVGGTLMTFKTYSVAYLELMHRLWNQGEPGSQERKDGRKAAMLMIATLMLMSGVGGLPFGEDAEDLIDGAAQLMGYNFSAQKAKQQFLEEVFGQGLAGFIEKGVTGLPGMPLDVSGRLGMGNLIPGTGLLQERTDHTRDVLEIAGPAGDMASRFVSGGRKILGGDIGAGLLEMSPTAVRNAAKGVDMAATGMYRDTKGYKVLETSHLEAAMKAIGFQPASVAQVQEANWLNQRAKAFYSLRAQEIRAQWAAGIFERDQAKVAAARQQVADWNARNPDQPMIIRVPDIMRRVREMAKPKDQRIADTAPKAMRAQMKEELARSRE